MLSGLQILQEKNERTWVRACSVACAQTMLATTRNDAYKIAKIITNFKLKVLANMSQGARFTTAHLEEKKLLVVY